MATLLGLGAALAFGVSDFWAGVLSRRVHFALVGLVSQAGSTLLVWVALPWAAGAGPSAGSVGWGVLSGVGGGFGSLALYRGLGRGQMTVVGPLSAVGGAALPACVGVALGERPVPLVVAGVLLALPAIALVASPPAGTDGPSSASGWPDGLLAGAGFALLFIGLDRAGDDAGLWPVASGQAAALLLLLAFVAVRRPPRPGNAVLAATGVGALSVTATLLYFFAANAGLLTVAAVLTSLYPGVTVLLATVLLHERATAAQRLGLALCAVAVTAIVVA